MDRPSPRQDHISHNIRKPPIIDLTSESLGSLCNRNVPLISSPDFNLRQVPRSSKRPRLSNQVKGQNDRFQDRHLRPKHVRDQDNALETGQPFFGVSSSPMLTASPYYVLNSATAIASGTTKRDTTIFPSESPPQSRESLAQPQRSVIDLTSNNFLNRSNAPPQIIINSLGRKTNWVAFEDEEVFEISSTPTPGLKNTIGGSFPIPQQGPACFSPDDYLTDEQLGFLLHEQRIENQKQRCRDRPVVHSNRKNIPFVEFNLSRISPGKSVELLDGSFLNVESIAQDRHGAVKLIGRYMERQSRHAPLMPDHLNELVWIVDKNQGESTRNVIEKEINLREVRRVRKIVFTNERFPDMSFHQHRHKFLNTLEMENEGLLFCRWKRTKIIGPNEESVSALTFKEADPTFQQREGPRVSSRKLQSNWRRVATPAGGSSSKVQITRSLNERSHREVMQRYTFGDAFCGAGGASRGAERANLRVQWGFDKDEKAIQSYALNFRADGTECLLQSVDQFLRHATDKFIVDILHISPPCQPFSPAHTIPSPQRDEENQAALFSVFHLVQTLRPRVVTLEETAGLLNRHPQWFSSVVNSFVSMGYSVRWRVLNCAEFGVPQPRKRLFIIAAGPGDKLPHFPIPTHGDPALRPKAFVTIGKIVPNIPRHATHHDITRHLRIPRPPFNPNVMANTLTCGGGINNFHPSGMRLYTAREMASLQTFPLHHKFADIAPTHAKRQIGNAFPPVMARAIFRSVIKSLQETDGVGK